MKSLKNLKFNKKTLKIFWFIKIQWFFSIEEKKKKTKENYFRNNFFNINKNKNKQIYKFII